MLGLAFKFLGDSVSLIQRNLLQYFREEIMANGQQMAKENVRKFEAWVSERTAACDWQEYLRGNLLNRTEIARECGFAVSALRQNPTIQASLQALEEKLRESGVLHASRKAAALRASEVRAARAASREQSRIKALEEQNAAQKAQILALEQSLKRYKLFEQHLQETGRALKP